MSIWYMEESNKISKEENMKNSEGFEGMDQFGNPVDEDGNIIRQLSEEEIEAGARELLGFSTEEPTEADEEEAVNQLLGLSGKAIPKASEKDIEDGANELVRRIQGGK